MSNCLNITVAKLPSDYFTSGASLTPPTAYGNEPAPTPNNLYSQWVDLTTVTSVAVDRTLAYDEGETLVTYHDHTVTITAVLTENMDFGTHIDGENVPTTLSFNERLEKIYNFLSNQGLAINFGAYPGPIRKLLPDDGTNDPVSSSDEYAEYTKRSGWLVDSHNGPKPLDITMKTLPGQEAIEMVWKVKYRTAHDPNAAQTTALTVPRISNELRMDIGEDGDLRVIVDGTIFADSLADIIKARDYIEVKWSADSAHIPGRGNVANPDFFGKDVWAIVNGFKKTVTFNIEKTGRSAKFQIVYNQLKTNNAQPYYLRDIRFEQSLESNLLSKGLDAGFQMWKNNYKIKITIPPRMNANYAWYVAHLLITQQNRKQELQFLTPEARKEKAAEEQGKGKNDGLRKNETTSRYFPIRLKITHKHFQREINFEVDNVLICPLDKVLGVSCILNRVNNDYQRRFDIPEDSDEEYVPDSLSKQHNTWQFSTERGKNFDLTASGDPRNLSSIHKPHRDTAGTEIYDTGQNHDAFKDFGHQNKQKVLLVTKIYDAQDEDPAYQPNSSGTNTYDTINTNMPGRPVKDGNSSTLGTPEGQPLNVAANDYTGKPGTSSLQPFTITREATEVNAHASWISHNQSYEILETNPTLPVDGLAAVSKSDFSAPESSYISAGLTDPSDGSTDRSSNAYSLVENTNCNYEGRTVATYRSHDEVFDPSAYEDLDSRVAAEEAFNALPVRPQATYAMTAPRYYIKVTGHALRVKYKVPVPAVLEIAGQKAIRVGTGRFKQTNQAPGADLPVYLAMWEQTYTIDKSIVSEDILSTIQDTGASCIYV